MPTNPENASPVPVNNKLAGMLGTAVVLALLYLGREVLVPITLAVLMGVFVWPWVQGLRRLGVGTTLSVWLATLALTVSAGVVAAVIGTQVFHIAAELPQYEKTIRHKLITISEMTLDKMGSFAGQADRVLSPFAAEAPSATAPDGATRLLNGNEPVPVVIRQPAPRAAELISGVLNRVWSPLVTAGIVFVVLVFVLLDHEALRDRLIRLVGSKDLRATTQAVNDAAERLARFFVAQFALNLSVGAVLWVGLLVIGLPHAVLWACMVAVLRFVPYVGFWIAAICATLLAAAIDPCWSLTLSTAGLFIVVETLAGQWIEPRLYAHSTGLSPISVVVAALFWSWIWGPVGLVVSTPLTLCLVVAGRYVPALSALELLFGEVRALTLAQNFYQRALSGDAHEILASARTYLKRQPFSAYCDNVLLPGLHLARHDFDEGRISQQDGVKLRNLVASVIETLAGDTQVPPAKAHGGNGKNGRRPFRPTPRDKAQPASLLEDVSLGRQLRARREQQMGPWQGPLGVPDGSVILCVGLGGPFSEVATEILVRLLRREGLDARHVELAELHAPAPPDLTLNAVAIICMVSTEPEKEGPALALQMPVMQQKFSHARLLAVLLNSPFLDMAQCEVALDARGRLAANYQEALSLCCGALNQPANSGTDAGAGPAPA
ncbi:AI-2E family transporter [Roseateles koreensis]|uniref:AI-2E family transporter n=1 Tax=Roseateles koreensis TaxID=2987526 RepID=A0ABT5KRP9_9BURK|nr:AI-2E family transporter [Roseateles koreensis]MDC8785610.1 AI-2E family transporter [Roseateles koreensis]